jgi:hypothetical protein
MPFPKRSLQHSKSSRGNGFVKTVMLSLPTFLLSISSWLAGSDHMLTGRRYSDIRFVHGHCLVVVARSTISIGRDDRPSSLHYGDSFCSTPSVPESVEGRFGCDRDTGSCGWHGVVAPGINASWLEGVGLLFLRASSTYWGRSESDSPGESHAVPLPGVLSLSKPQSRTGGSWGSPRLDGSGLVTQCRATQEMRAGKDAE